jgi:hypothetical protein
MNKRNKQISVSFVPTEVLIPETLVDVEEFGKDAEGTD